MGELRNPKLEKFARALLSNIAAGMPRAKAAHEAALVAGYKGKTAASNARKYAGRRDVKARLRELAAPMLEKADEQITATLEWAVQRLCSIAGPDLGEHALSVTDQIAALRLLAQMSGWMAPTKSELTGKEGAPLVPMKINIIRFGNAEPNRSDAAA